MDINHPRYPSKTTFLSIKPFIKTLTVMRKLTLTILLVVAVAATWAQKPDRKTAKLEKRYDGPSPLIGFRVIAVRKK